MYFCVYAACSPFSLGSAAVSALSGIFTFTLASLPAVYVVRLRADDGRVRVDDAPHGPFVGSGSARVFPLVAAFGTGCLFQARFGFDIVILFLG